MGRTIVCGVDGSADSQAALGVAASMAEQLEARLVLAHIAEPAVVPYDGAGRVSAGGVALAPMLPPTRDEQEEESIQLLEQIAGEAGLEEAERRVAIGFPAEQLAELADEVDAELIVVGSRGRGAFKAALLGSVSTSLIGVARCPVLVVPPGATADGTNSRSA
jgi:nucleotide-binding universal stress UspA family protein